jgi:Peptidase M76 family
MRWLVADSGRLTGYVSHPVHSRVRITCGMLYLLSTVEISTCSPGAHAGADQSTAMAQVVICHNHVGSQQEIDIALVHELVHAYDHCRGANLDWSNCEHHACSEVQCVTLVAARVLHMRVQGCRSH